MEFLEDIFSEEEINNIIENNGEIIITDLKFNSRNALEVIDYLKEIGINNIYELFLFEIEIFFKNVDVIKEKLENINVSEFVNRVNNDFYAIEELY